LGGSYELSTPAASARCGLFHRQWVEK